MGKQIKLIKSVTVGNSDVYAITVHDLYECERILFSEYSLKEEIVKTDCGVKYKHTELNTDIYNQCTYPALNCGDNRLFIKTNGKYNIYLEYNDDTTSGSMAPQRVFVDIKKIDLQKAGALPVDIQVI
jgi:hypothetical protein